MHPNVPVLHLNFMSLIKEELTQASKTPTLLHLRLNSLWISIRRPHYGVLKNKRKTQLLQVSTIWVVPFDSYDQYIDDLAMIVIGSIHDGNALFGYNFAWYGLWMCENILIEETCCFNLHSRRESLKEKSRKYHLSYKAKEEEVSG